MIWFSTEDLELVHFLTKGKKTAAKVLLGIVVAFSLLIFQFSLHVASSNKVCQIEFSQAVFFSEENSAYLTPENWAEKWIEQHEIFPRCNASDQFLTVVLPIDKPEYYSALQKKIGECILKESERPKIELRMVGEGITKNFCAILGGMGPLSDARILELVIAELKEKGFLDQCAIHLLSAPPPRGFIEMLRDVLPYLIHVHSFLNEGTRQVYLASNTAHIHIDFMNKLGKNNIANLVQYVADRAKTEVVDPCVFIVGTKAAKEKKLYERLFQERGVRFVTLPSDDQEIIQEEIEKTKMGMLNDGGERAFGVICKMIKEGSPVNLLLLGCTELSIALQEKREQLEALGVLVLDSEQLFAEKISADMAQSRIKNSGSCRP